MTLRLGLGLQITRGVAAFSPLSLDPVAFYDPSDTSTLFQDAAGTTSATTAGDPVGLMLDKSQGASLGPEMALSEMASFDEVRWSYDAESGTYTRTAGTWSRLSFDPNTFQPGTTLKVSLSISDSVGLLRMMKRFDDDHGNETWLSLGDGDHSFFIHLGATASDGIWFDDNIWSGSISNISIREIPGNHLTAPSDAARPTLQANGTLSDDGIDDALIAPITGTYSAYIAAGASLISDESVVMADDYDVLRDDFIGAVIVSGTLDAEQKDQLAQYWGVTVA